MFHAQSIGSANIREHQENASQDQPMPRKPGGQYDVNGNTIRVINGA